MRRFNSLFEILKFPLKVLFIAYIIMGLGMLMQNENFAIFYTINNSFILMLSELMVQIGAFVVVNFPLLVIIKLVSRKTNSSAPIIIGVVGYAVYLITTMIMASPSLPQEAFSSIMNLSITSGNVWSGASNTVQYPIQTGLIAAFIVGFCTRFSYRRSGSNNSGIFLGIMDKYTVALLTNMMYCMLAGVVISLSWPYLYAWFQQVMTFMASDIGNPLSLFLYGIIDRSLTILNMNTLLRVPFWFGANGGSWSTLTGEIITGDVAVWNAIIAQGDVPSGFGRLITPYYVLNIFAIPGMLLAMFSLYSSHKEKVKNLVGIVILISLSMLVGILLPLELMLLFLAPVLLLMHIMVVGCLFAALQIMNVFLGFSATSSIDTLISNPGTLFDYAIHFRNPAMQNNITQIAVVGGCLFVIYFIMTRFFFKYLAFDMFQTGQMKIQMDKISNAMGGLENIDTVESSIFRLTIRVHDNALVQRDLLLTTRASKVSETKDGFVLVCGKNSVMIASQLEKIIKNNKR